MRIVSSSSSILISLAVIISLRVGHLSYTLLHPSSADSRTHELEFAPVLREGRDEENILGADALYDPSRSWYPSVGSTTARSSREDDDGVGDGDGDGDGDDELSSGSRVAPAISLEDKIFKLAHEMAEAMPLRNSTSFNQTEVTKSAFMMDKAKAKLARLSALHSNIPESQAKSPACHPHFGALTSNSSWTWSNTAKFRRLYFYHARKAGGTSLADYFNRVAHHHGLKFDTAEWAAAEEPGTHEMPTFYVAHLREPIDRAISHFKYQGRWNCRNLTLMNHADDRDVFVPTEENANKLESWNETGGHVPTTCDKRKTLWLGECAVNCYTQWFSGLSCPQHDTTTAEQYRVAMATLLRYNFVVILERLADPAYARAVEEFFGVPGVTKRRSAFCERTSHAANKLVPLSVRSETKEGLIRSNGADIDLYGELAGCLDGGRGYGFPKLDEGRFEAIFPRVPHFRFDDWRKEQWGKKRNGGEKGQSGRKKKKIRGKRRKLGRQN